MRLLVVEDDAKVARLLGRGLGEEAPPSTWPATGRGRVARDQEPHDAIVLHVMLPDVDGFEVRRA